MDLAESFEGEEGAAWLFLCQEHGGPRFLTFFLHGKTVTGEWAGESWTI
jgi:hypothetical protein